jgi:hypothetical protein
MAGNAKIYLRFTGRYQGVFKGKETVSLDGDGDDWFEISSLENPPQGVDKYVNGRKAFKDGSLTITKILGTLAFAKAQAIGEPIDKIEIVIVLTDKPGAEQVRRKKTIFDALITSRTSGWDSANRGSMESMSITYQQLEYVDFEHPLGWRDSLH